MITRIKLATLPVRDQDRAVDFFVGKLGMKVRTDQPYGPGARWIEVAPAGGGTGIILSMLDDATPDSGPLSQVVLGCDDAAATATALRDAGVEVTDPVAEHWGTFILVTEPDGRQICITEDARAGAGS